MPRLKFCSQSLEFAKQNGYTKVVELLQKVVEPPAGEVQETGVQQFVDPMQQQQ